ncbi:MAG: FtsX-like permease family protein, partial [Candidatus Eisenbacteria bacterium]
IGADLESSRAIHPQWRVGAGPAATLMGSRLRERLGLAPTDTLRVEVGGRVLALPAGATLEAGGPADDAWWVPLAAAQTLAGLPGRASLVQSRVDGSADAAEILASRLERESGSRVLTIRALSETEALLLERMRRLMTLVTAAALVAAGLCAFGTLTDLALARRREIALMKALGASERDIVRALTAEAAVIGLLGGLLGFAIGLTFAHFIGRQVFNASIHMRWDVVPVVMALALGVAGLASFGPIRLALNTDPASALKGD